MSGRTLCLSEGVEILLGVQAFTEQILLRAPSLSGLSADGPTCCRLAPRVNDPMQSKCRGGVSS